MYMYVCICIYICIYICMCISIYLFIYLSTYLSIYLSIYYLSIYLYIVGGGFRRGAHVVLAKGFFGTCEHACTAPAYASRNTLSGSIDGL